MQNVNGKFYEEGEGLLEECDEDSFYNIQFSCMNSFFRTSVYYDNINPFFSPPYLTSDLTTIFL